MTFFCYPLPSERCRGIFVKFRHEKQVPFVCVWLGSGGIQVKLGIPFRPVQRWFQARRVCSLCKSGDRKSRYILKTQSLTCERRGGNQTADIFSEREPPPSSTVPPLVWCTLGLHPVQKNSVCVGGGGGVAGLKAAPTKKK